MKTCIGITSGEPAGIGPDLLVQLAQHQYQHPLIAIADADLLLQRAKRLNLPLTLNENIQAHQPGQLSIFHVPLASTCQPGVLNTANARYVLDTLTQAANRCLQGELNAIVTPPVHKGVLNQAGYPFSGHTEFFAELTQAQQVVMLLANEQVRVALATTHLPLRDVADKLSTPLLVKQLTTVHNAMQQQFGITQPRIAVCGLNPHAGENGYLGTEEQTIILPAIETLSRQGINVTGPVSADTIFASSQRKDYDVIFCQYHDQGLPVVKALGFGETVNISLGLPIIRTSVDHGTALALAGTLQANASSLLAATKMAIKLSSQHESQTA